MTPESATAATPGTRLVVLAWGNDSRGDDALGPRFLARAEDAADPPGVTTTFVADFQLQPEHAVDLDGHDLVLFVDAGRGTPSPYRFREIHASRSATFTTHGLEPGVVLDAFRLTFGRPPPPAFELAIRGETFELGMPPCAQAQSNLEAALGFFALLRRRASAAAWRGVARDAAPARDAAASR